LGLSEQGHAAFDDPETLDADEQALDDELGIDIDESDSA
jgi:hypothetical protein